MDSKEIKQKIYRYDIIKDQLREARILLDRASDYAIIADGLVAKLDVTTKFGQDLAAQILNEEIINREKELRVLADELNIVE